MKKITMASFVLVALIGLLIAATPKKQLPPNFQTSYETYVDAVNDYLDTRESHSIDSVAAKALLLSSINYLHSHWTLQEVNDNVDALWPQPVVFLYACWAQCDKQLYNCIHAYGHGYGDEIENIDPTCAYNAQQCRNNCGK